MLGIELAKETGVQGTIVSNIRLLQLISDMQ